MRASQAAPELDAAFLDVRARDVQLERADPFEVYSSLVARLSVWGRRDGHLVLLRTAREQTGLAPTLALLSELGVRHTVLDATQCLALEPGLNADTPLQAGLHLPGDEVGNCRQFAMLLRAEAERLGALFRFHSTVESLQPGPSPRLRIVHSPHEETTSRLSSAGDAATPRAFQPTQPLDEPMEESFDAVVVCAAMGSADLLRPHGLRLPMAAVFGQSVTAPIRHVEAHPDIGDIPCFCYAGNRPETYLLRALGTRIRGVARTPAGPPAPQPALP